MNTLLLKLKQKLSSQFIRNIGWLGAAQVLIRIFRLGTTITTARLLSPEDFGLVAIVLSLDQFIVAFSQFGISEKLAQVEEELLEDYCHTVFWLGWLINISLCLIQCLLAFPLAHFYGDPRLVLPIFILSITYLIRANSIVQGGLVLRENRLNVFAISDAVGNIATNLMTIVLALLGAGYWSLLIPQVLLAPLWVIIINKSRPWQLKQGFSIPYVKDVFNFGYNIFGLQVLSTLRGNIDNLLIGRFLGIEALGMYYFAFNSGLGISLSLLGIFNTALYPHLCAAQGQITELKARYLEGLKTIALVAFPLILLQSSLAHFYIPIIFGQKWIPAIPIVVLICLSALPRPFADAASRLLWAVGKPNIDLGWSVIFSIILTISIVLGLPAGIIGVATSVLLACIIFLPLFTLWASHYVFKSSRVSQA
ncbi:lipopolysaccharide biosynthesis protein [Thermosynechococcaceae cyanobacterium BACA0444]|uniref:Lipopolysaccharide biosynthesis protein n=1 Tax=Pseudocalidococcus azoricus BACA0444 TaxID=2918990 RepID=A0AAE4JUN5_9CYAN|nr:lipopolysaccharide biosynthesis protein [Pseudocalidococcus azoricus]MDS3859211.1 lipopolysaccharide biosynthesis protein [Pseudocalidococcus azoricus BACA0444]